MKNIEIAPVSRIEGHAKITVQVDDSGNVSDAHFHVMEIRGFEKFLEGAAVEEAPRITPRICGICQTSHHITAAKATDQVFGLEPPETAKKLRELLLLGQFIMSHSLHFYFLAAPDLVLGPESDPALRNVVGILKKNPDLAMMAIKTRKIGQEITAIVGGKPISPVTAVPGGQSRGITTDQQAELLSKAKEATELIEKGIESTVPLFTQYSDAIELLGPVESHFAALTNNGDLSYYEGNVKVIDSEGNPVTEFSPVDYLDYIEEKVQPWSYMKFPYLKQVGFPEGNYRVGPLARLNVVDNIPTPRAAELFAEFRENFGIAQNPLLYHYARLIELMYSSERAIELLEDNSITGTDIRQPLSEPLMTKDEAKESSETRRGVGMIEATRGILIHDYETDAGGYINRANLIVSTSQNNLSMDIGVRETAKKLIHGEEVSEGLKNQLEMIIRAYDPCLSCATHAIDGSSPLEVDIYDSQGILIKKHLI
ncbi:MAG: Ni/Fe hydrogenase subunit alpha [Euryarchaeota archaeon]|jgi:F420-non-reducing hydrogenase large subunit|uniref:Ni/Fe hydrogenase subunit alpha n=1 Tax=Methanobacterium sp. MZD130B TaxID=3394378 RepID=UPI001774A671|nr:Ni/Fe hydrogenase subunit alpha [Euryarchaeota archaeon]HHT18365.1 Ni/Fe hydrogenase subunit alpha [Methanobacterium sp.]